MAAQECLSNKCIDVVVNNFETLPVHENIPARYMREISNRLSIDLDANTAAEFVFDESYWKRRCLQKYPQCNSKISEHGLMWKQLFFETHIQQRLEEFEPDSDGDRVLALLSAARSCQDYIFVLATQQLLGHPDVALICKLLPNLTRLEITYGIRKIGMKYDRMLFGMKISDAHYLAKTIITSENLTTLALQSNLIDDDLLRMLMTGLIKNSQITHLDLAHNKITNHGVRLLSKLLGTSSVLTSMSLADNQIHAEGGRYLGRALRINESLVVLNLRLNRLLDEGGRVLLDGLCNSCKLAHLNLSGNSLAGNFVMALTRILASGNSLIQTLDLSCNELTDDDMEAIARALENNKILTSMDVRMNHTTSDALNFHNSIHKVLHQNELNMMPHT